MRQIKISHSITNRDGRAIQRYLQEIGKKDLLSSDEEAELSRRIRKGDAAAVEELVSANLRFVVSVAKQYEHPRLSLGDLINEGNLGLVKAAMRFDETRGFKFISYAVWWINQSIMSAIAEEGRQIRIPVNKYGQVGRISGAARKFRQLHGEEPTDEELADLTNIDLDDVVSVKKLPGHHLSLDAPSGDDPEGMGLYGIIPGDEDLKPDNNGNRDSLERDLQSVLSEIPGKESEVLKLFFGIGCEAMTLNSIGARFGLTSQTAQLIKNKAMMRIKRNPRYLNLLRLHLGN